MRLLDEVIQIAFTTAVEVAEENQPAAIAHNGPMREVDGAHAGEITIYGHDAQNIAKRPDASSHEQRTQCARLKKHKAAHVVLLDLIFERPYCPELRGI